MNSKSHEEWEALTPADKEPYIEQSEQLQKNIDIWRETIAKDGRLQKIEALQTKLKETLKALTYDKPKQPKGSVFYYSHSCKRHLADIKEVGARVSCFCFTYRVFILN